MNILKTILKTFKKVLVSIISFPSKLLPSRWLRKMNRDQRRVFNLIVTGTIVVLGTWVGTSLLLPDKSQASWWNDSWKYRQTVTATNTSPFTADDIPYRILMDTATPIAAGKMKADGSDIRIVNSEGKLVRFQVEESTINTTETGIWFDADVTADNSAIYYIYYGNSSATTPSFPSDITSSDNDGTTVTTKDGFEYRTTTSYGRVDQIKKDGTNLGVNGHMKETDSFTGNWWGTATFTRTQLAVGPLFVEVDFNDTNKDHYSSFGNVVKLFKNGFVEEQTYMNYNSTGSENLYYYLSFTNGTRNSVWVNASEALVDQSSNSGGLNRAALGHKWFGQRWTDTGNYGGTIISQNPSDWTSGQTSAQASYYQTNYSTTEAYTPGTIRKIRYGTFAGSGTVNEMHQKASLLGAQSTTLSSEETGPGPIAYWKFEGNLKDSTVNNNDATPVIHTSANQKYTPGIDGKAIDFTTDEWGTNLTWVNSTTVQDSSKNWTTNQWTGYEFITNWDSVGGYCRRYITSNTATQLTLNGSCNSWSGGKTYRMKKTLYISRQINYGTQNVTASVWFKRSASKADATNTVFRASGNDIAIEVTDTTLNGYVINYTNSFNCSIDGKDNNWHHAALTYDGTITRLYYDGKECNTKAQTGSLDNNEQIIIGSRNDGFSAFFEGYIDEMKIYPYTRSAEQIRTDYNAGSAAVLGAKDQGTLANGLVGYWKMDETTGSTTADTSGNGNTGTATNTTITTGKYGNSRSFAGADYISVPDSSAFSFGTSPITIASWVKFGSSSLGVYKGIISQGIDAFELNKSSGNTLRLEMRYSNNTVVRAYESSASLTEADKWYHVAATFDPSNGTAKLYVDGIQKTTVYADPQVGGTIKDSSSAVYLGSRSTNQMLLDGSLDETRVYNRALSPAEIKQLYNYAPPPVAYYDFEEKFGTTAYDRSGNGNNGTWYGTGNHYSSGKYGSAAQFNGSDDYVNLGTPLSSPDNFTYSFWFYTDVIADQSFEGLIGESNQPRVTWEPTSFVQGGLANEAGGWGGGPATGTLALNKWHYITFVVENGSSATPVSKLYVNGTLADTQQHSQAIRRPGGAHYLNFRDGHKYFKGKMDEVRIYNYARTPGQIVEDMNAGHPIGGSPVGSQHAYYKFDEGSGTTANDSGPNSYTATLGNATWSNSCKSKSCVSFDGTSSYVNSSSFSLNSPHQLSISFWANPSSGGGSLPTFISDTGQSGTSGFLWIYKTSSTGTTMYYQYADGTSYKNLSFTNAVIMNEWHHYTFVADYGTGKTVKLYRDGKLIGTETMTTPLSPDSSQITFGRYSTSHASSMYQGKMDEVKFYSTALTGEQIKIDYNSGQSLQFGTLGTEADGTPSNSTDRMYCPPGDTTASCGPVGEWKLDERTGTTAKDTSGNDNNGTLTGGPTWTSGKVGSALQFDGTNDYVLIPDSNTLDLTGDMTMEAWVYPVNDGDYNVIISKDSSGEFEMAADFRGGASILATRWGGTNANSNNFFNGYTDQWVHVTVTVTGSTVTYYRNGALVGTSTSAGARSATTNAVRIGDRSGANQYWWNGKIDQVRLFNYTLSPAQIAWNYNRGAPVAHYKFDECQGSTVHSSTLPYNSALDGIISVGASGTQTSAGTCQTAGSAWGNGVSGKYGGSLNFDGTDDYMTANIPVSGSDGSVSLWVKNVAQGTGNFIFRSNANIRTYIMISGSTISFSKGDPSVSVGSTPAPAPGKWKHLVLSWYTSGGVQYAQAFADGVAIGNPLTFTNNSNGTYITAGGFSQTGTQNASGQIDDVQIFNYSLTPQQVKTIMNQGAIRFGP